MQSAATLASIQSFGAYTALILIFLFGVVVLFQIVVGKIDISGLLSEDGGGASMSRFQLLIITFVIAFSFFVLVVQGHAFPEVPSGVLTMLGISATTYGVSKGIQASAPGGLKGKPAKPLAKGTAAGQD
jgi:hypothetical protein